MLLEKLIGSDVGLWDRSILTQESKINIKGIHSFMISVNLCA
jgi:hypothetical protein